MENCWIPRGHPPDPDQAEDRVRTPKEHHDRAVLSWKRPKTNETCVEHALAKHDRTDNAAGRSRTRASSWTHVMGISTSTSIAVDMDGGMASYTGAAGVGAVEGAGSDAASAAAIDGADMLACDGGRLVCGLDCLEIFELSSSSRVVGRSTTRSMLLALDSDDRFNSFSCLLR